jgi:vacuolar iron transporter family protein
MLTDELGLNLGILGSPIKGALVIFVAFLLGGVLPIILYSLFGTGYISLEIAIGTSICSLFIVGALKARNARKSGKKGGIEMAGLGTGIALVRYGR